jgi:hypothetical protein
VGGGTQEMREEWGDEGGGAGDRGRGDLSTLNKFTSGGQMSQNLHLNTQS